MPLVTSVVRRCVVLGAVLTATAALALPVVPASATAANPVLENGSPWGIYQGSGDGLWPAYEASSGQNRELLGKMALHARVRAYGHWIATGDVARLIAGDIAQEQGGDPNVLVWMAIFRLWPHEEADNKTPLSPADQQAYRNWVDQAAIGIGSSRVGIVLEPDLPFTLEDHSWGPKVRAGLARYAAQKLGGLPNASVYLDGGSSDWLKVPQLAKLLESAGIQYVRGVSLGASHHVSTASEIRYCRLVGLALARDHFPNQRCVIDTSDNGHPYSNQQFYAKYPRGQYNANNPTSCKTMTQKVCVALGIPPTTDVTNSQWKLPAAVNAMARTWVDAYIWTGHPWKINNAHDFDLQHALEAARTDPYF